MDSSRKPHAAAGGELNVDEHLREGLEERAANVPAPCPCTSHLPNSPTSHLAASVKPNGSFNDATSATAPPNPGSLRIRPRKYIHVLVRSLMGSEYSMRMRESDTVERIKLRISARSDIPCGQQQLIFKGVELQDQMVTAKSIGIQDGSVINLIPRLQAGPLKMHAEGVQGSEDMLIDTVTSQLSDAYMSELLMSGQPVSLIAKVSGKFVMVKLRPRALAPTGPSPLLVADETDVAATAAAAEKQQRWVENDKTKKRMEEIRGRMAARRQRLVTASPPRHVCSTLNAASGDFVAHRASRRLSVDSRLSHVARGECFRCSVKLGVLCYPCRCGNCFCPEHQTRQSHGCPHE